MKVIFISDDGDDSNDGLTESTPVRTVARALLLAANDEFRVLGVATFKHLVEQKARPIYSKSDWG